MASDRTSPARIDRILRSAIACMAIVPFSGLMLTSAMAAVRYVNPLHKTSELLTEPLPVMTSSPQFVENASAMQKPWDMRPFVFVRTEIDPMTGYELTTRIPGYLIAIPMNPAQPVEGDVVYRAFSRINPASGTLLDYTLGRDEYVAHHFGVTTVALFSPCTDKAIFDLTQMAPIPGATEEWQVGPAPVKGQALHSPLPLPVQIDARGDIYITGAPMIGAFDPASPSGWRTR